MNKIIPYVRRARRRQSQHHGFWMETPDGHSVHVTGDPNMDQKTREALMEMADLAVKQFSKSEPEQKRDEP